ncbi:MAG: tetratricopeptide repeat protein [Arenicellales bacterium]|nr:tetratricopeptide repeat protein [Arenicellales bacterium]
MQVFRAIFLTLVCWCVGASADQNDPRLENLFQQLHQAEDFEEGESITQQIWKLWYEIQDEEARDLFDRGVALMARADYRSALLALTRLTEMKPQFAEAWNRRATLLYLMGEYSLSMRDIRTTLALEPRHFGAISGMGQILMRQNRLREARKAFEQALEINPHLMGAQINIIQINKMLSANSV